MENRVLGRTGRQVGVVGLGAWQLGADWGAVDEADAMATLHAAVDAGVTFIDTADVYGDGRSEQLVGRLLKERPDAGLTVATKMGRRVEQVPENYTLANFLAWNDRSRANLGVDTLDLVQLHCPPTPVYADEAVYDALDSMVAQGRIAAYGVSVETCAQALTAIARPGVASVQIILNMLRLKPLDEVLPAADAAGVGHHRAGTAGQRPALRPVRRAHHVRRRRPPQLQPARRGVRRRRDVRRGAVRDRPGRGSAGFARWLRPARRWPSSRCAGSSTSRASAR